MRQKKKELLQALDLFISYFLFILFYSYFISGSGWPVSPGGSGSIPN